MEDPDETKLEKEQGKELSPLHKQQIEEDEIIKSSEEFVKDYPAGPPLISATEQEMRQQEFSDSFHDGYNLAKNDPKLYDQVLWEAEDNKDQSNALIWGKWMFEQEMKKDDSNQKSEQSLSEIQSIRTRSRDKQKTRER